MRCPHCKQEIKTTEAYAVWAVIVTVALFWWLS